MWSPQLKSCCAALRGGWPGIGAVRRLCPSTLAATSTRSFPARRFFSSEEVVEEEVAWSKAKASKYGFGNYQLFRPLYKDLCDEMRREYYTKPPPPPPSTATAAAYHNENVAPTQPEEMASGAEQVSRTTNEEEAKEVKDGDDSMFFSVTREDHPLAAAATAAKDQQQEERRTLSLTPTSPPLQYGDGIWSVGYKPEHNVVTFQRSAVKEGRLAEVHAWSRIELKDPPRLNAVLTFADWIPIEVCVERNGVIIHFSMASNEGGMHMRNVRVYAPTSPEEKATLLDPSDDGEQARKKLYYDGPCLWHLELDFHNELYDVMQDHGITLDWVNWAASWVFYLEHVNYVKWNVGLLEELIPSPLRGPESDFLSAAEKALLEEPVEDWLSAHSI
jgi:hypothetical protein